MKRHNKIKIIWLSANLFGYELLKEAIRTDKRVISAILTLSRKAKTKMYDGIESKKWKEFNVPVYEIKDINKEIKLLKFLNPDYIIMAGWRQFIDKEVLNIPQKGFIGFHPTLLPEGRGAAPIINTILSGFKKSGVTMLHINEKLDGGDIIGQTRFPINGADYAEDLYCKVIEGGKRLIKKFLPQIIKNKAPRKPQNGRKATYFPKRTIKDNEIKLGRESAEEIYRKIRAFSSPYLGAYVKNGNKKLIIWRAELKNEKAK
jgi:methionyl-tRNA formyltransferase